MVVNYKEDFEDINKEKVVVIVKIETLFKDNLKEDDNNEDFVVNNVIVVVGDDDLMLVEVDLYKVI